MRRSAAATSTTTASPAAIALSAGPLGYNGSKAAMELIAKADVVLALGTRLNPFSTLPGYGIDYWPQDRQDHPGRHQPRPHRPHQDGRRSASAAMPSRCRSSILAKLSPTRRRRRPRGAQGARSTRPSRPGCRSCRAWTTRTTIPAPPGTPSARKREPDRMSPRQAWRAIQAALPEGRDHLLRHRQQLRHRQCLSDLRGGPQISGARPVRPLRLRLPVDHRRQDRLPRRAGGRLRRRRRLRHLDERDDARSAARNGRRSPW